MFKHIIQRLAVCGLSAFLAVQAPLAVYADEAVPADAFEITEDQGITEVPEAPSAPETTPDPGVQEPDPGVQEPDPGETANPDTEAEENNSEEEKEVLPISTEIQVSGEAGNLTLVLNLTNASFITENISDFTSVFSDVPAGVSIAVAGQSENSVTFHISGNAAAYTRSDLVMHIPANWLKNTAEDTVEEATEVDVQDYFWFAHADFGIRLKSKGGTKTNEDFIDEQNLTKKEPSYDKIRFLYKKMDLKVFTGPTDILEYPAEDARIVGKAEKNHCLYEIVGIKDGWVYVESGKVRGFVKREQVADTEKELRFRRKVTAKENIPATENMAYTYVRITGSNPLVKEEPRVTAKDLEIKEEMNSESRTVGTIKEKGILCWLSYEEEDWIYVESGDVRGFVEEKDLLPVKEGKELIEKEGTEAFATAEQTVEPEENKALYYRMISCKKGDAEGIFRQEIVDLARAYIGNPYVYGGTDPIHGIDCSAFMQFLFGNYGIGLPRVSKAQGFVGTMVTMDTVEMGDILIYADDAEIYHVVLYAGDGKTVEAADETQGVLSKDVNTVAAVWGISLLDKANGNSMPSEIAKPTYTYETQEAYETRLQSSDNDILNLQNV